MSPLLIRLTFHGDLPFFLASKASTVERQLSEKTSVKDVIEACGVPHTEVDLIIVNGVPVDFACVLRSRWNNLSRFCTDSIWAPLWLHLLAASAATPCLNLRRKPKSSISSSR